jgi:pyruvate dehydrogenase E1 component
VEADIIKGLYRLSTSGGAAQVRLLGSGTILREAQAAAELLAADWDVKADVWSATSFSELARDARECERWNRLHPGAPARNSHVAQCLPGAAPVIAATDYVRAWPQLIASHVAAPFTALGTDGFGRSDTRAALRRFFEVDRHHIVLAALTGLASAGRVDAGLCASAIERYRIDGDAAVPWSV